MKRALILACAIMALAGCSASDGAAGAAGQEGAQGEPGEVGPQGPQGPKGDQGEAGKDFRLEDVSGTRLKARYASTADGAKVFVTWFDEKLNIQCDFIEAEDGKTRCLPGIKPKNESFVYEYRFFETNGCGGELQGYYIVYSQGEPRYFTFRHPCSLKNEVFRVTDEMESLSAFMNYESRCGGSNGITIYYTCNRHPSERQVNKMVHVNPEEFVELILE